MTTNPWVQQSATSWQRLCGANREVSERDANANREVRIEVDQVGSPHNVRQANAKYQSAWQAAADRDDESERVEYDNH